MADLSEIFGFKELRGKILSGKDLWHLSACYIILIYT